MVSPRFCHLYKKTLKGSFVLCLVNHMSDSINEFLLQMAWKLWQSASFLITSMKRYQFAIMTNQESLYVRGFSKISKFFLSGTYARAQM